MTRAHDVVIEAVELVLELALVVVVVVGGGVVQGERTYIGHRMGEIQLGS